MYRPGCASRPHRLTDGNADQPVGSVAVGIRQIAVGVGSPPLKGTLTLPAGSGPFPAVALVSGSGPNDQDETDGPNHPLLRSWT